MLELYVAPQKIFSRG